MKLVRDLVEFFYEPERLEVFVAPMNVRYPFAGPPRIIEVDHRGDRVDPQPVYMVLLQPEESVRYEEIHHLFAAVIEDKGPPVFMFSLALVHMLVKACPVEEAK